MRHECPCCHQEVGIEEKVKALVEAAEEFCAKVERGEARSVRSYTAFKQALAAMPDGEAGGEG